LLPPVPVPAILVRLWCSVQLVPRKTSSFLGLLLVLAAVYNVIENIVRGHVTSVKPARPNVPQLHSARSITGGKPSTCGNIKSK
jgi:hypothetical protein